jgi:hypothetical protein
MITVYHIITFIITPEVTAVRKTAARKAASNGS